jgi:aspartate racemase
MTSAAPRGIWGVLGGLGPRASAEFLRTIYEQSADAAEQHLPRVIMISDPAIPDRTDRLERGDEDALVRRLEASLDQLIACGATHLLVCCVTMHAVFGRIGVRYRERLLSLVDVALEAVSESARGRHLLLCSRGSRGAALFERHSSWRPDRIVLPGAEDQGAIHDLIYALKRGADPGSAHATVEELLARYDADAFIAGCTELHLITKTWRAAARGAECIDPLELAAARIVRTVHPASSLV